MVADRHRPRRFTCNGHLVRITTEFRDVVADPAQRRLLVGEAVIADIIVGAQRRMREKAQRTKPVIESDDDDVAPGGQPSRVVDIATAVDEPPAVNPHHHRKRLTGRRIRGPHVQGQAVLAD